MGDITGEYAGHARTGMFLASRNCVQILATWGHALSFLCGSVVEHCVSSAKGCGFDSQGTHTNENV